MKKTLTFQVAAFTIYLINHFIKFFVTQNTSQTLKIGFGIFLLLILSVFIWDYRTNFKKQSRFKISAFLFLFYGIVAWLADGFYYIAVLNVIIFAGFYLYNKKFELVSNIDG